MCLIIKVHENVHMVTRFRGNDKERIKLNKKKRVGWRGKLNRRRSLGPQQEDRRRSVEPMFSYCKERKILENHVYTEL